MATNDFLPFAYAGGANVVSQATYAGLSVLSTGYQSGVATSAQLNKTWRQSSIMAAVLAQFISDNTGQNSVDDGTTSTLLANLKTATTGRLLNVQTFTASGTYTPSPGTTRILLKGQGAGGGGGGALATAAGQISVGIGGAAGSIGESFITSGFAGATVTIGAGGTAGSIGAGGNGGSSTFGALMTLTGGTGGAAATAAAVINSPGATCVAGSGGNILNLAGQNSAQAACSFAAGFVVGSAGANSLYGGGGGAGGTGVGASVSNGLPASGRGSGGGGSAAGAGVGGSTGGTGAGGIFVVYEYA